MKHRTILLALVGATLLMLPSQAAAGEWKLHPTQTFLTNMVGTSLSTEAGTVVTCFASSGSGKTTSESTGEITFTFNSCKDVFGTACTTPGLSSGSITSKGEFTFIYLANKARGIWLKGIGESKQIAEFKCLGGATTVVVSGDLIGEVTSPTCNGSGTSLSFSFAAAEPGIQKQMQITGTGTKYDATATINGTPSTAAVAFGGSLVFGSTVTMTCP